MENPATEAALGKMPPVDPAARDALGRAELIRRVGVVAAVAVALGAATAAAVGFGGRDGAAPSRGSAPPNTAEVTRVTLVDVEDVQGELGYGAPEPLRYTPPAAASAEPPETGSEPPPADDGQHLVTWLPAVGSTVDCGDPLFRVDDRPVPLLFGPLPVYRGLSVGVKGPDVAQFEGNLRALGYSGFTADEAFTASTASAVKRWQRATGLAETGAVAPGQVIYAAGPIRVAEHTVRVGDPASGDILKYTGTTRMVLVQLGASAQRYAGAGTTVTVLLPGGASVTGTVDRIGPATEPTDQGPGEPTVPVVVAIADQRALGDLLPGPVQVRFVAEERKDVLTVPVVALVALIEGGYGVQVVDGSTTRYVAVRTGMFAGGRVEVTSPELRAGLLVAVPK